MKKKKDILNIDYEKIAREGEKASEVDLRIDAILIDKRSKKMSSLTQQMEKFAKKAQKELKLLSGEDKEWMIDIGFEYFGDAFQECYIICQDLGIEIYRSSLEECLTDLKKNRKRRLK